LANYQGLRTKPFLAQSLVSLETLALARATIVQK